MLQHNKRMEIAVVYLILAVILICSFLITQKLYRLTKNKLGGWSILVALLAFGVSFLGMSFAVGATAVSVGYFGR